MCGRFTHHYTWKQLHRLMSLTSPPVDLPVRYNVAPTQAAPVVRADGQGGRALAMLRWGLVPSWAKEPAIGNSLINARSEGVESKPAFRSAFKRRRCLVPVSGFYEWAAVPGAKRKQPYYIRPAEEGGVFALAGLWESWRDAAGGAEAPPLETFTILTTTPNEVLAPIHNRMPVILDRGDFDRWLAAPEPGDALGLLKPCPAEAMLCTPVSTRVNSPRNDDAECVQAIEKQ